MELWDHEALEVVSGSDCTRIEHLAVSRVGRRKGGGKGNDEEPVQSWPVGAAWSQERCSTVMQSDTIS